MSEKIKKSIKDCRVRMSTYTKEQRDDLGQKVINEINKNLATQILFVDPLSGEELRPIKSPEDINGDLILIVENKDGSLRLRHTIKTEEI